MNYYRKYFKYKLKYLKLKGGMKRALSEITNIEDKINAIYLFFITNNLEQLKDISTEEQQNGLVIDPITEPITELIRVHNTRTNNERNRFIYNNYMATDLTPNVYNYASPKTFENDKNYDEGIIIKLNNTNDSEDEYRLIENYGKLIEIWIADNCRCPICKEKTLRRYSKNNFPIIDLVCINENHVDDIKFFQVKTSEKIGNKSNIYRGRHYFNLDLNNNNNNTILAGSRDVGQYIHNIKPSEIFNENLRKTLNGYICILYTIKYRDNNTTLKIDMNLSFIVLPNFWLPPQDIENDYYYKYVVPNSDDKEIKFNTNTNNIINLYGESKNNINSINHNLFSDDSDTLPINEPNALIDTPIINTNYDDHKNKWIIIENPLKFSLS